MQKNVLYKTTTLLSAFCLFLVFFLGSASFSFTKHFFSATASGVTSSDSSAGQVQTTNQDGTLYLTTQTNQGGTTQTTGYQSWLRTNLLGTNITPGQGYAANLAAVINSVLNLVLVVAALLVFMQLILGAFEWLTSGGDKGKIDRARQRMISSVIGLVIVSASYAITVLAVRFLGFQDLNDVFNNARTINNTTIPSSSRSASVRMTNSPTPTPTTTNYNYDSSLRNTL